MFSIKEVNTGTSILGLPVGSKKNFRLYKKEQTCLGDHYLRSVRSLVGDRKATAYGVVLTLIATRLWLDLEPTVTAKKKNDSEKEQDS